MFIIINAFDRSGGSMFAKLLAKHPDIECLFQPFNNSIFRRELFEYWNENTKNSEGTELVKKVMSGVWDKKTINTPWFHKHTSNFDFNPEYNYVIKTTNLHLKYKWFKSNFPSVKFVSLIRNPLSIMASLSRNGFMGEWYKQKEFEENLVFAKENAKILPNNTLELGESLDTILEKTAYIIGLNNYMMLQDSDDALIIKFEDILDEMNTTCKNITNLIGVEDFDYELYRSADYNVIGDGFSSNTQWKDLYNEEELSKLKSIFKFFGGLGYAN